MPPTAPATAGARARRRAALTWLVALVVAAVTVAVVGLLLARTRTAPLVTQQCTATVDGVAHELDPAQAGNAALITAVAVRRGLPARAATIALATSIQESGLRNLEFGDRDSLGLFQQRPSQGWGTPEQLVDPLYATNAFYDALVAIDGYESLEITDASDRVQRSAFPNAVADHEPEGRAFASSLTGHSPAALTCRLRPVASGGPADTGPSGLTPGADAVVAAAMAEFGEISSGPATPSDNAPEGTAVTIALDSGAETDRLAWALAQWAVASADRLDIVAVTVDGSTWRREDLDAGWADTDGALTPGTVVVEVAAA